MTDPEGEIEILLVEDDADDAELTLRALRKVHVLNKVLWVKDGQQALHYLCGTGPYADRGHDRHPKLILLDLKMPKIGGIEVLTHIRSDARMRTIPVVVMTSSTSEEDVTRCYRLGVNSYVSKPLELGEFAEAVAKIGRYWIMTNRPLRSDSIAAL